MSLSNLFKRGKGLLWRNLAILCSLCVGGGCGNPDATPPLVPGQQITRIVSMAPSLTECLFAIGAGDRVCGVTTYCNFPPKVNELPRVGGIVDANFEKLYALQPDLVVLFDSHITLSEQLDHLNIPYVQLNTSTLSSIFQSMKRLGEILDAEEGAQLAITKIQTQLKELQALTKNQPSRRVMVSVGRSMGTGSISDVYVAGTETLYEELLTLLGAENVYKGSLPYARMSAEGILDLAPDVIIDLVPDLDTSTTLTPTDIRNEWNDLQHVPAVASDEVHVLGQSYVCIPGPRINLLMQDLARAIYPECFETAP